MSKIAILIPQFYWGGMPRVASHLIRSLMTDYRITLILVNTNLKIREETYGVEVIRLHGTGKRKFFELRKILRKNKFKAVISFGIVDNILNILEAPRKTKTIITEHSTKSFDNEIEKNPLKKVLYALAMRFLYSKADKIVAVSAGIKNDLERVYKIKDIETIYNISYLNERQEPLDVESKKLIENIKQKHGHILINAGRITQAKGQMNLVRSMQYMKSSGMHLILLGEGPDVENIRREIKKLHLENNVHLVGTQMNIMTWLKESDVYVTMSWFEGFPTVLTESIENGIPVISSDIYSGPREILSNGKINEYETQLEYPLKLQNGILTDRFDFRDSNTDFSKIEKNFALAVETYFKEDVINNNLNLDYFDNEISIRKYKELIESK